MKEINYKQKKTSENLRGPERQERGKFNNFF